MIWAICERLFSSNSHYITARMVPPGHCPIAHARDVGAVLSETVATVSLSTDINRCSVQRPFFTLPCSGGRCPVTAARLTVIS